VLLSQDVRKKAQAIQKQNTTPHMLSRGGYDFLEKKVDGGEAKETIGGSIPTREH